MAKTAFQGTPVSLAGEFVKVGAQAPEFSLVKGDLSSFTQDDIKGKYALLNIFPSMDTGVCAASVRKFNKLAAEMKNTGCSGHLERFAFRTGTLLYNRRY